MHRFMNMLERVLDIVLPLSPHDLAMQTLSIEKLSAQLKVTEENGMTALFPYRDPLIKHMIWSLKYRGNQTAASLFADILADALLEELAGRHMFGERHPILIPIPLSRARAHERGYNHMEYVAAALSKRMASITYLPDALTKHRETKPQTSLSRKERLTNVHGAFTVPNPTTITGQHVIVIDDVITTGSTMKEAQRALLEARAKSVECIAIAH